MKLKRKEREDALEQSEVTGPDLDSFLREAEQEDKAERQQRRRSLMGGLRGDEGAKDKTSKKSKRKRRDKTDSDLHQWTGGSLWATRAATASMLAAMVCGPAALAMQMTGSDVPIASAASGYDARMMNRRDAAGEAARQTVSAWIGATRENQGALQRLVPGTDSNSLTLPEKAASASNVQIAQLVASGPGVWTATVAADVTMPGSSSAAHRYFQVPVAVGGSTNPSAQPLSLPAEVPAPGSRVSGVRPSYPSTVASNEPAYAMTAQFLNALLTRKDNISLYERPGTTIPAVGNAPWKNVRVTRMEVDNGRALGDVRVDGTQIHVLTTVALSTQEPKNGAVDMKTETSATYALTLTSRAGRWEISALDAAPQLNTASTASASSTGSK